MTQHETLAAALAAMQAELPKLRKDETAKVTGESKSGAKVSYSYGYAGLDQVVETVLPALGKHGMSVTAKTVISDSGFILEVSLLHEGGEREIGFWPLPDPRRSGPQDIGSAMTYGRRYLTLALTGTFPGGEDDDGAKAQASAHQERWEDSRPSRTQEAHDQHRRAVGNTDEPAPAQQPKTSWTDDEISAYHDNIRTVELGKAVNGYDWMAGKGLHKREVAVPDATNPDGSPVTVTATDVIAYRLSDEAVTPGISRVDLEKVRIYADERGLLKVQVSETETLDQVVAGMREQLKAKATDTPEARQKREDAAASWDDNGTPAIPGSV
jgi:hypothetical protein